MQNQSKRADNLLRSLQQMLDAKVAHPDRRQNYGPVVRQMWKGGHDALIFANKHKEFIALAIRLGVALAA